jgi:hypothetical protein
MPIVAPFLDTTETTDMETPHVGHAYRVRGCGVIHAARVGDSQPAVNPVRRHDLSPSSDIFVTPLQVSECLRGVGSRQWGVGEAPL